MTNRCEFYCRLSPEVSLGGPDSDIMLAATLANLYMRRMDDTEACGLLLNYL